MELQDKRLQCVDCGTVFIFTVGEQLFFREKHLLNEPKRCRECKAKQVALLPPVPPVPGPKRIDTPVVCSRCGRETTVPFIPRQDRPVLCRECFQSKRSTARFGGKRDAGLRAR